MSNRYIRNNLPAGMATATCSAIENETRQAELASKKTLREKENKAVSGALSVIELGEELGTIKFEDTDTKLAGSYQVPSTPPNPYLEIRQTPYKGISMFAKATIPRGTLILAEKPLMRVTKTHYMAEHVEEVVERLTAREKKKYWGLASAHGQDRSKYPSRIHPDIAEHERNRIRQQHDARTSPSPTALSIFMTNAMECENGAAVFEIAARFNHSCIPNAFFSWNTIKHEERIYACRTIEVHEEITLSYCDPFYEYSQRKWELQHYGFVCVCPACINLDDAESFGAKSRERRYRLAELDDGTSYPGTFADVLRSKIEMAKLMREEGLSGTCLGDNYLSIARLVANKTSPDFKFAHTAATQALDIYTTCLGADSEKAIEAAKSVRAFKKQIKE